MALPTGVPALATELPFNQNSRDRQLATPAALRIAGLSAGKQSLTGRVHSAPKAIRWSAPLGDSALNGVNEFVELSVDLSDVALDRDCSNNLRLDFSFLGDAFDNLVVVFDVIALE